VRLASRPIRIRSAPWAEASRSAGSPHRDTHGWSHDQLDVAAGGPLPAGHHCVRRGRVGR
jgi:hypothetical protein